MEVVEEQGKLVAMGDGGKLVAMEDGAKLVGVGEGAKFASVEEEGKLVVVVEHFLFHHRLLQEPKYQKHIYHFTIYYLIRFILDIESTLNFSLKNHYRDTCGKSAVGIGEGTPYEAHILYKMTGQKLLRHYHKK